jgi:MFS transporter, PPP family, 3-phenylpropionic acid transporter
LNYDQTAENPHAVERHKLSAIRVVYFFYFAGFGIYITFINVYFRSIGMSSPQIGLINMLSPVFAIFGGPLFGLLNDRFGISRLLLALASLGAILGAIGISMVTGFLQIMGFASLLFLCFAPMMPVIDSVTLRTLGKNRASYGRQRLWGSVGYIITSLSFGFFLDKTELRYLFYGFSVMMFITMLVALRLPAAKIEPQTPVRSDFKVLLLKPEWILFTISLVLLGTANSGMMMYLGIYITELGGGEALVGSAVALGAIVELPVMVFSALLFRHFSARRLLILAFFFYALRFHIYSILPSADWVLPVSLLHGLTFGLYWIASVSYANELTPKGLQGTGQGLLLATINLAAISGAIVGGLLYDRVGPFGLFRVYSVFALAALTLQLVGGWLMSRLKRKKIL